MAKYNLDKIRDEFLKYAPSYALTEAGQAIDKLIQLQKDGLLQNGVYYLILIDLVGSTKYGAEFGNEKLFEIIKTFIKTSFEAMKEIDLTSKGIFLKEIGDSVLYIFHHFNDFLNWRNALGKKLIEAGEKINHTFQIRTCVHIGEVTLQGVNPLGLSVAQIFKMEKNVNEGDIVLTSTAFNIAWPTVTRAHYGFSEYTTIELDGYNEPVKLFKLDFSSGNELQEIIDEQSVPPRFT